MKYLHTMVRVKDQEASLDFYVNKMGMVETRRKEFEKGRFTLIFLAGSEDVERANAERSPELELTYNWDENTYQHGTRYGHIALGVTDIYASCRYLVKLGVTILRNPGPMTYAADGTGVKEVIAFIEDPDGYKIELIQSH